MDSFIKKIFDSNGKKECDGIVHVQFQKFSRGEFNNKAIVLYSHSKDKYTISTTYEYANDMVRMMAEILGPSKTNVTGVIVSTRDLKSQLKYTSIKQFAGVKQYILNGEMSGHEIIELLNKLPPAFFALSMKVGDTEIKIKPKAPISGKPSTKADATPKADFCKLYTTDKNLVKAFIFDHEITDATKKAEITHTLLVQDIILPKGETDPKLMRENAKRKGKVIRQVKIEDVATKKEAEFTA